MKTRSAEEIFLELAGLGAAERAESLDRECGGNASLREAVERLEASEQAADSALRVAIGGAAAEAGEAAQPRQHIGPYLVVKRLGHGGMGTVYLAVRDDDEYRKEVAIKVARASLASEESLARFRFERQVLASLEHPNIARLLEGGTTPDGEPYIVMEYVAGGVPITEYAAERGLDTIARLRLLLAVAAAVDHAHRHLVVHRDLKPSNILVSPEGEPKLLDFGIAKILQGDAAAPLTQELTQAPMFTRDYSSPEQQAGRVVSVASDVYSLGLVLCELLTGSPRRAVHPGLGLPRDLAAILHHALEEEPRRRYPSVREFALDVERYLDNQPVTARRPSSAYRAWKFLLRHRAGAAAAALLVAMAIAVGWWSTLRQSRRAQMRLVQVRQMANAMLFDLHDRIRTLPGSTEARIRLVETAQSYLASLEADAAADPRAQAGLAAGYERLADVQGGVEMASAGRVGAAVESYRKAVSLREKLAAAGGDDAEARRLLADVQVKAANALGVGGASAEARLLLDAAVRTANAVWQNGAGAAAAAQTAIEAEYRLGDWLLRKGRAAEALPHARNGLAVARRFAELHPGLDSRRAEWTALRRLGDASHQAGQLEEAQRHFAAAAGLLGSGPGALPGSREAMLLELAQGHVLGSPLYLNLDQPARAEEHFRRALAWARARVAEDPKNNGARSDLATVLPRVASVQWERNPAESLQHYDETIAIREAQWKSSPESVDIMRSLAYELANSANPLRALRNHAEAERRARRAIELDGEITRRDPVRVECCSDIPMFAGQLGDALLAQGKIAAAGESYQRAVAVAAHYGRRDTCGVFCAKDWAMALERLARWQAGAGRAAESRAAAAQAVTVWRNWTARNGTNQYFEKKIAELGGLAR